MRIVHFSDFHGDYEHDLPPADLYVCTGDMLPNFPGIMVRDMNTGEEYWKYPDNAYGNYRLQNHEQALHGHRDINVNHEIEMQNAWCDFREGAITGHIQNKKAPVIIIRGNHDFVSYKKLFYGMKDIREVGNFSSFTIGDTEVVGFRGISYIAGEWSDEMRDHELQSLVDRMGKLDFNYAARRHLLVTHAPPANILDYSAMYTEHYGIKSLASYLNVAMMDPEPGTYIHCFGHVHGARGVQVMPGPATYVFSNAATTVNTIEVE